MECGEAAAEVRRSGRTDGGGKALKGFVAESDGGADRLSPKKKPHGKTGKLDPINKGDSGWVQRPAAAVKNESVEP